MLDDDIIEIADESSHDTVMGEAGPRADAGWISRFKLRVDTRKWATAKLAPKKYGDRLALTNGDGKPLPVPEIRIYTGARPLSNSKKEVDADVWRGPPLPGQPGGHRESAGEPRRHQ